MRGTGKTTKQIKEAPKDAIYVCDNRMESEYCKKLARINNRQDITFVSKYYVESDRLKGLNRFIVIDHATCLDSRSYDYIRIINSRFK